MGKIKKILEQFEPISSAAIKKAFEAKIAHFDFDGVIVDDVDVDLEGNITVSFSDIEGDQMDILFVHDEEEGSLAIILDDDENAEEFLVVDLDALGPSIIKSSFGNYLNVAELSWMNKSALVSLFVAGDIGLDDDPDLKKPIQKITKTIKTPARFGFFTKLENIDFNNFNDSDEHIIYSINEDELDELKKTVIRGGKKVKLAVVRKLRRKRLTPAQKVGIRKAVRKRKAKKGQTARKRKKSLKLRKRLGLGKQKKLPKGLKVAGTASRKR